MNFTPGASEMRRLAARSGSIGRIMSPVKPMATWKMLIATNWKSDSSKLRRNRPTEEKKLLSAPHDGGTRLFTFCTMLPVPQRAHVGCSVAAHRKPPASLRVTVTICYCFYYYYKVFFCIMQRNVTTKIVLLTDFWFLWVFLQDFFQKGTSTIWKEGFQMIYFIILCKDSINQNQSWKNFCIFYGTQS